MPPKFLNERLVTVKRFAPPEPAPVGNGRTESPPPTPPATNEEQLAQIIAREEREVRAKVDGRDLKETEKRRREVAEAVRQTLARMERDEADLSRRGELLRGLLGDLERRDAPLQAEDLQAIKRTLFQAHMETVVAATGGGGDIRSAAARTLASEGFWRLTRAGLALTWPLVVALVAAGGLIAWALFTLFAI